MNKILSEQISSLTIPEKLELISDVDMIFIVACFHVKCDPKQWKKRIK